MSETQRQKFHTDDANQCLHNKSGSHGGSNINLSSFMCLLVGFGKVMCLSANELQQNSNASSREDYIPQILTVLLEILCVYIWALWPFVSCLSFVNNSWNNVTTPSTNQRFWPDSGQSRRRSFSRNVPSGEERGETDVFAGYIICTCQDEQVLYYMTTQVKQFWRAFPWTWFVTYIHNNWFHFGFKLLLA